MRLILLIIIFCFSCLSFGQDSLRIDTTFKALASTAQDSVFPDSAFSVLKTFEVKKKIKKKKVKKLENKVEPIHSNVENSEESNASRGNYILIIFGVLVITVLVIYEFTRPTFVENAKLNTINPKDEDFISDYLSRKLLTRRDYYRNVYLKSEEWKRKRFVVLKRDNWRCVYCGGRATQVHHTRYAKRNIGKEPIEWLVSICKTCHDSKH